MTILHNFGGTVLRRRWGPALTLLGLALFLPLVAQPIRAHGGGTPQLTNSQAGPYRISVWTAPDPIQAGELHITVAVLESTELDASEAQTGDLVLDATVQVQVEPVGQTAEPLIAYATHENAINKLFYEADLDLPAEGQWRVVIQVDGPAGVGTSSFDIEARPSSAFSNLGTVPWPAWGALALVLIIAIWSVQKFRTRKPEAQHA